MGGGGGGETELLLKSYVVCTAIGPAVGTN